MTLEYKPELALLLGQVSLFNNIRYRIILNRPGTLFLPRTAVGHFFNLHDGSIANLFPGPRQRTP